MAPIPSPRESGFTHTTGVPLYWARYGRVGAPVLLVLHGGPGAHHDYLLPQFLDLAGLVNAFPADIPVSAEVPSDSTVARLGELGWARKLKAASDTVLQAADNLQKAGSK